MTKEEELLATAARLASQRDNPEDGVHMSTYSEEWPIFAADVLYHCSSLSGLNLSIEEDLERVLGSISDPEKEKQLVVLSNYFLKSGLTLPPGEELGDKELSGLFDALRSARALRSETSDFKIVIWILRLCSTKGIWSELKEKLEGPNVVSYTVYRKVVKIILEHKKLQSKLESHRSTMFPERIDEEYLEMEDELERELLKASEERGVFHQRYSDNLIRDLLEEKEGWKYLTGMTEVESYIHHPAVLADTGTRPTLETLSEGRSLAVNNQNLSLLPE